MRDIVVVLPRSGSLQDLADALAASPFEVVGPSEGLVTIRLNGEAVQFVLDQTLSDHYEEPNELALLASLGNDPKFFLVNFKTTKSLGEVLAYTVDRSDAIVDNDFGIMESGSAFVQRFRKQPDWDWVR